VSSSPSDVPSDARSQIAVIGDLHSAWDEGDVDAFNRSKYSLLLFTGDLGGSGSRDGMRIAKSLSRLTRPALVMPGNNDVELYASIAAELTYRKSRAGLIGNLRSEPPPPPDAGHAETCGYSAHSVEVKGQPLTIIAGRPFAMGGNELSFPQALEQSFGIRTLAESVDRLKELVDGADTRDVLFLSHNGPAGVGAEAGSLWGSDFRQGAGDWGDTDLTEAILHARRRDRRILAVVAGHMHWTLEGGGVRASQFERDGTLYLNPARVPRILGSGPNKKRHHFALTLSASGASAAEVIHD
jgi:uncharacterized protein (TIGR04168 family)